MPRIGRAVRLTLLCLAIAATSQTARGAGSPLLDLMRAELQRNMTVLQKEPVPPYFASYTAHDSRDIQIVAAFGGLQRSDDIHSRAGAVEVRVGDYALDSTHPLRSGQSSAASRQPVRVRLPLSDDEPPTRAALWRATDRAFKQAVEALTRVKTNVASTVKEENPAPDFSHEEPQVHTGTPAAVTIDTKAWEQRLRRISAAFADDPLVFQGSAGLEVEADTRYFVNTEGTALQTGETSCQLFLQAMTKADDGMELPLYATYFARTLDGLPAEAQLMADAREMTALLGRLRKAPLVDPYTGPAVLSGRAAGVFFHEIFGHRIEGHRQKNVDDAQTFAKRVGQPILPTFLSVVFDPTEENLGSQPLVGHYEYDDEGVKARRVPIVENGVLKTFLLSRAPLDAFPTSNGHGRGQPGLAPVSRQSNLFVESSQKVSQDRLMAMLKDEARRQGKPFGLLFENIEGGFTFTGRTSPNAFNVLPNVVYRVYTDNRPPELVRGVDLIGTPLAAFGKIVATGDKPEVFNGVCGAESGSVPVSATSPALLVSEVEVQKKAQSQETSPILPAPVRKPVASPAQDPPILVALQEELKRSMDGLRMKDQPAPYFIAFRVDDLSAASAVGTLGAIVQDASIRSRSLQVEVRVGDYAFDNSRFISGAGPSGVSGARVPIDDDMNALRRQVWLTTDAAYKRAVNVYSRKKAAFQNRADTESVPDFSLETPIERVAPPASISAGTGAWIDRVRQISAVFLAAPDIQASDVVFSEQRGTRYYVTSEGTKVVTPIQSDMVRVLGEALATDGTIVRDAFLETGSASEDLGAIADLLARTSELTSRLTALRSAPAADTYAGPVLVEGEGAAELLAMTFAPMLTSRRAPDTENPRMNAGTQSMSSPYLSRLGSRVLPEAFTVTDTPSLTLYEGAPVAGAYLIDDEGVAAKDVTLVENGMLRTLLTTRTPQQNLLRSNGHARGSTTQPAVFQMRSTRGMSLAALRQTYLDMLRQQGKPFGYIVRAIVNPSAVQSAAFDSAESGGGGAGGPGGTLTSPQILRAVRVTPDGREEPVRGLQFGPITHTAFRTIADASTERPLRNTRIGGTVVSLMVPSLIFEDLEIQKNRGVAQKAPVVPTPLKR